MIFFRKPLHPEKRTFRPFLLAVVIMATCYGFWVNNQKRLDTIALHGLFHDQTKTVSAEDKRALFAVLKTFKPEFGFPLEINVLTSPPNITRHDPARMYLDILPTQRRVLVTLPPLVRRAVGPEFPQEIENMFTEGLAKGTWNKALLPAAQMLRAKMAEVHR